MEDNHKLVQWIEDYNHTGTADYESNMRHKFALMDDRQRTAELQNLSSWLNDGSSLRQKSQIARLGQELNRLHVAMRKVGR
jgi:hypothetical protein